MLAVPCAAVAVPSDRTLESALSDSEQAPSDLLRTLGIDDLSELTPAVRLFASFVTRNQLTVLSSSAAELSRRLGVSDVTIIRAARALGFDGLPHLKQALAAAIAKPARGAVPAMRQTLEEAGEGARNGVELALRMQRETAASMDDEAFRERLIEAVCILHPANRIAVYGVGPSGHLARYMTGLLNRVGRVSYALDATGAALATQLLALRECDALLALTYGRANAEIIATVEEAHRLRLPIVLVSDAADALLAAQASVVVPARRGTTDRIALHATTLSALEAIALGLASSDHARTMESLGRLSDLRRAVTGS